MPTLSPELKSQHSRIKKNVEKAFTYFRANNERYHEFFRFVNQSALTPTDEDTLQALQKPVLEFNITNAPISRLCGEYSKQEPSIYVSAQDGYKVDAATLAVLEGHYRHILYEAHQRNTQYTMYRDQLEGGFSNLEVYLDYANEMSFDPVIRLKRSYEPTLVGYDPLAREVTKCDAEWYYEIFPMPVADFKREYPEVDLEKMRYGMPSGGMLTWSYTAGEIDALLLCAYYELKKQKKQIFKLADGQVFTKEGYDNFLKEWEEKGFIEQPPVVTNKRNTTISFFCRYLLIGTEIIDYEETDFKFPSHIFVDGDSVVLKDTPGGGGNLRQFTKPYVYHAKGLQRLTNLTGQMLANDFENLVMHKFMVAKETIPQEPEYLMAYKNVQVASVLVYNAFADNDPKKPLPPPTPVPHVPLPPDVMSTFNNCMQMLQNILGSYNPNIGVQNEQISGIAIVESASQSNAAAMPYIVNNIQALNQAAQVIFSLIPKMYVTPRTIPIIDKEGHRQFVKVNQQGGVSLKYDANALHVRVEAGVSFAIAKNRALQQIIALMKVSPVFAQFINTEGLEVLLDNVEFRGVDLLKEKARKFMEELQKQQASQSQQPNPEVITAQAKQTDAQANMMKVQNEISSGKIDDALKMAQLQEESLKSRSDVAIALLNANAEAGRTSSNTEVALIEAGRKQRDQEHKELKEILELSKTLGESNAESTNSSTE